jgi:hypothetical protein
MKHLFNFISIFSLLIFVSSCKSDAADPTVDCNSGQTQNVGAFFNALNSQPGYFMYDNMDLTTHAYTFTTNADIQICGFGYKSQNPNLDYVIELTGPGVSFSQTMQFDNTQFEYIDVPPITLQAGGSYTLMRTVTNNSNLNETIGPITRAGTPNAPSDPTFPITLPGSNITITGATFYGGGGPVNNYGVPNIYFNYIEL